MFEKQSIGPLFCFDRSRVISYYLVFSINNKHTDRVYWEEIDSGKDKKRED